MDWPRDIKAIKITACNTAEYSVKSDSRKKAILISVSPIKHSISDPILSERVPDIGEKIASTIGDTIKRNPVVDDDNLRVYWK